MKHKKITQPGTRCRRRKADVKLNEVVSNLLATLEDMCGCEIILLSRQPVKGLMSSNEAAKYLGLSRKTLANWRNLGDGPVFHKIGGRCQYQRGDLVEFASSRKFRSTSAYYATPLSAEDGK